MNPPKRRARRSVEWLLGGALVTAIVGVLIVVGITRTGWGRERILRLTIDTLQSRIEGTLTIGRISGGLLTGATIYDLSITDPDGTRFLDVDSARLRYEIPTLLGGDMVLQDIVLYDARLLLTKLPGDTLWNYRRVLPPGDASDTTGGRATILRDATLHRVDVLVRLEWRPDDELAADARQAAIDYALSDTSGLVVAEAEGGFVRTMRFVVDSLHLPHGVLASRQRGGNYFRIDRFAGELFLWRDPLRVRQAEGEIAQFADTVEFRLDPVILPASRLSAAGIVDLSGPEPRYDLVGDGEHLAFSDLQPAYGRLPASGSAELSFTYETLANGSYVTGRDLRMIAPGTTVVGDFQLVSGDTLRFVSADLEAPELRMATVEAMLPTELPVTGLHIGTIGIGNPAP